MILIIHNVSVKNDELHALKNLEYFYEKTMNAAAGLQNCSEKLRIDYFEVVAASSVMNDESVDLLSIDR